VGCSRRRWCGGQVRACVGGLLHRWCAGRCPRSRQRRLRSGRHHLSDRRCGRSSRHEYPCRRHDHRDSRQQPNHSNGPHRRPQLGIHRRRCPGPPPVSHCARCCPHPRKCHEVLTDRADGRNGAAGLARTPTMWSVPSLPTLTLSPTRSNPGLGNWSTRPTLVGFDKHRYPPSTAAQAPTR
jgi:hypothetical protein